GQEKEGGAKLASVTENGPSAKAGLKADDLVVSVDGKAADSYNAMLEALRPKEPGTKVKFGVGRGGTDEQEKREVEMTLVSRPADAPARPVFFGVRTEEATGGVRVAEVVENSSAAKAGIKADDVIQSVEGKEAGTPDNFANLVRENRKPG